MPNLAVYIAIVEKLNENNNQKKQFIISINISIFDALYR